VKEYLRFYSPSCTFSNALSPAQVAAVTAALDIVQSEEGEALRRKLMENVAALREEVRSLGMEVYGDPSAIVAVRSGDEALARLTARELPGLGLLANLVEFPAVAKGHARFRLQVMAGHSLQEVASAAAILRSGMLLASEQLNGAVTAEAFELAQAS
jgi:glycine C-acetyltransferase